MKEFTDEQIIEIFKYCADEVEYYKKKKIKRLKARIGK